MNEAKIRRLPQEEIQKIAAGEVVERPASVLKELLENSLDAGATVVSIYIEQAGKKLIRVVDNGCGMSRVDAQMAFEPHATSKLRSIDDLYSLSSYGFRGEALCSIAAVSRVTLVTAEHGAEDTATKIVCSAGVCESAQTVVAHAGSDLSVADLFCSVPVRLKFLKKEETEWNQLYDLVQAVAFSSPTIFFSLYKDGQRVLHAPAVQTIVDRAHQLWESQHAKHVLLVDEQVSSECCVRGLISAPAVHRYNRADILLFVNGRWIKNQNLLKAVVRGYAQALPEGKFPMAVLFLTIATDRVDINVHPRKEEVAFVSPGRVEAAVVEAVKATLQHSVNMSAIADSRTFLSELKQETQQRFEPCAPVRDAALFVQPMPRSTDSFIEAFLLNNVTAVFSEKEPEMVPTVESSRQEALFEHVPQDQSMQQKFKVCGQLFKTYILLEVDDVFLIMDQHAAHERILYEKMKKGFEEATSVAFVVPLVVTLSVRSVEALMFVQDMLKDRGIVFERFGQDRIRVFSFAVDARRVNLQDFFQDLAKVVDEEALDAQTLRKKIYEHVHSHTACKAAVKAGDLLSEQEMVRLYLDLQGVENRHMCIHGRPTLWRLPKNDIEKHFRRK